jgi:hypothetical protein
LERLTSFYEAEGRFPHSGMKVSKMERLAYRSMVLLRNDFSDEPEVKNLLSKKPNVSAVLQEGITLLLEFVNKTGRLPVDNQKPISGERRALATWKTLKKNYPDSKNSELYFLKQKPFTSWACIHSFSATVKREICLSPPSA